MASTYGALIRGQMVVIALRGISPPYVGKVQEVSEYGVRITLMDWTAGDFVGFDFFAPWISIQSAIVAVDDETEAFLEYAKGVSK